MILGVYDILAWLIIGSLVGALCGKYKGRVAEGIAAGMVLGPLGWLLMLLAKDMRARCPECGGLVVQGVRRCQHCRDCCRERSRMECES